MPNITSPAGPSAVRSTSFSLAGYVVFSLKEVHRQQFTLNKVIILCRSFMCLHFNEEKKIHSELAYIFSSRFLFRLLWKAACKCTCSASSQSPWIITASWPCSRIYRASARGTEDGVYWRELRCLTGSIRTTSASRPPSELWIYKVSIFFLTSSS